MYFTCKVSDLSAIVSACAGVSPRKTTLPILTNVLLTLEDGKLTCAATDLDVQLVKTIDVTDMLDGAACLPAQHLASVLKALPQDGMLRLLSNGPGRMSVTCGPSKFEMVCSPADEFPRLRIAKPDAAHVVLEDVQGMLSAVAGSVSTDETRYVLNGVLLERIGGVLHAVSTDGHRLTCSVSPSEGPDMSTLLPRKALREAMQGGSLKVYESGDLCFDSGLSARAIEGKFPDWRQVMPKHPTTVVRVNSSAFMDAMKRVMLMSSERSHAVRVDVSDGMTLSTQNPDRGEASESIACDVKGKHDVFGFNAAYLLDAVRCVQAEYVEIGFTDPLSPCKVTSDNAQTTAVVMPMRI